MTRVSRLPEVSVCLTRDRSVKKKPQMCRQQDPAKHSGIFGWLRICHILLIAAACGKLVSADF